jgi:hypothetical protein
MKKLFFLLASSMLLFSCHRGSERETTRRIVNMTKYSLEIKILSEDTLFYAIDPWGSLDIKGICEGPPYRYCNVGWSDKASYGEIIFDDNYRQVFESFPYAKCSDKSIIQPPTDNCYGYNMEKEEDVFVYTYIVNNNDYENAELIE